MTRPRLEGSGIGRAVAREEATPLFAPQLPAPTHQLPPENETKTMAGLLVSAMSTNTDPGHRVRELAGEEG